MRSLLTDYVKISPTTYGLRTGSVDTITIHHAAGKLSVEALGSDFAAQSRKASSNYGVGDDGRIACYVEEEYAACTSSNRANDMRAITIEVVNSKNSDPWPVSDDALEATISLCVDICERYGKTELVWIADKNKALAFKPASTQMRMTVHQWFSATACPGPYLLSRMDYIAAEVTRRLQPTSADTPAPSSWAASSWRKICGMGVMDGTDPQGQCTREMLAVVLDRLGVLK